MMYICHYYDGIYIVKKHETLFGPGVKIIKVIKKNMFVWLKEDSNILINNVTLKELTDDEKVKYL